MISCWGFPLAEPTEKAEGRKQVDEPAQVSLWGQRTGGKEKTGDLQRQTMRSSASTSMYWDHLMILSILTSTHTPWRELITSHRSVPIVKINSARFQFKIHTTYFHLDRYRPGTRSLLILFIQFIMAEEKRMSKEVSQELVEAFFRWCHRSCCSALWLTQTHKERCGRGRVGDTLCTHRRTNGES